MYFASGLSETQQNRMVPIIVNWFLQAASGFCLQIDWGFCSSVPEIPDIVWPYLLGKKFKMVTDHAPLTWIKQNKERNPRVYRLSLDYRLQREVLFLPCPPFQYRAFT